MGRSGIPDSCTPRCRHSRDYLHFLDSVWERQCAGVGKSCYLRKRLSGLLLERKGIRRYYLQRWPSTRSMKRVRARIRELTDRRWHGVKDVRVVLRNLNPVLQGWANYFRTGNAARKFNQLDRHLSYRLRRFMVQKRGKRLRPGQTKEWTREWFWGQGLLRLRGMVRYPNPCMLHEKAIGKPCAGKLHARFERRRVETGRG